MAQKPVIFLAFANDKVDDTAYLRNLPKELDGIRNALQKAVKAGLCEVVERGSATIDNILDVFQDYKDRIAIFHYGGHANGYQLLLETLDGKHASAHSEGLVSFLAKQRGLQLVFLNGCSSQQQALDLTRAGIPAVIGTSQSISDDVATKLALRFYKGLALGASIEQSWQEAIDEVKITKGSGNMRDLFWEGMEENAPADAFPWSMHFKDGADIVKGWSLPEAAGNPLFGLPEPARIADLPEKPFRFLERYRREHADVFFGRSYFIRELFSRTTDKNSAPIILFYGQSGVGKSSLLDAGLFPRLSEVCQVIYVRRDPKLGLLGTLMQALGGDASYTPAQPSQKNLEISRAIEQLRQQASAASSEVRKSLLSAIQLLEAEKLALPEPAPPVLPNQSIAACWKHLEAQSGKPLVVLLDQVEEIYTRPNPELPLEVEMALLAVQEVFGRPEGRPLGKLILSYRKEYNAEIEEALKKLQLPREKVFLRKMEKRDIVEVVNGITQHERLRRAYRLSIDEELPYIIADDLLEDKSSPIAPILQILLTKMWQMSEGERHFSVETYQQLKKQGILMDDFFHEQMEQIRVKFPDWEASGLALDLLQFHTTELGTANSHSLEELRIRYGQQQEAIEALTEEMKRLYLLSDAGLNATGLAHDTLAPIVSQEFRRSDRPGQRAALILENKRIAFEQDENSVLDIDDLRLVEEGASGMRIWMKKEEELIEKSRVRRAQLLAEKKRNRFIINSLTLAVCIGLIVALWQWRTASLKAQANALVAKALQTEPTDPTKALRMVEEAQQISASPDTWQLMSSMMGKHEFYQQRFEGHRNRILDAALQGEFVFTVGEDSTLRKWDRKGQLLKTVEAHQGYIFALSSNGQLLATASADGLVKIWDEALSPLQTINAHEGGANEVCWAGDTLFTAGQDGRIACYLATGQALWRIQAHTGGISAMAAYQGRLFSVGEDSTLRTWTHAGKARWSKNLQTQIFDVEVLSNAHIATADNEGKVRFWDMEGNEAGALFPQTPAVRVLKALPDGQLLTAADYPATTAKRWNMEGKLLSTFEGHGQAITAFAVQDHYLITGSRDHTALLWDLRGRRMQSYSAEAPILQAQYSEYGNLCFISGPYFFFDGEKRFEGHTADITCFSLHESSIATGSRDSTVRFWSSQGQNLRTIKLPEEVTAIAESSNRLFVATRDNLIRVLDKQGKILDSLVGHTGNISAIVILPNGQISSAGFDSTLRVWDVHTKQAQILRPHAEAIADLALWGNDLLSGGWDGYARGKGMTFRLSEDFVNAVAVHHNTITLGSFDGDIGIFDEKGALLQRFKAHAGGINSVSFGRECLLTAGDDSKLHLWFLQPEDFLNSGRIYKP